MVASPNSAPAAAPAALHTRPTCASTGAAALSGIDDATLLTAQSPHEQRRLPTPGWRWRGGRGAVSAHCHGYSRRCHSFPTSKRLRSECLATAVEATIACLYWSPRHTERHSIFPFPHADSCRCSQEGGGGGGTAKRGADRGGCSHAVRQHRPPGARRCRSSLRGVSVVPDPNICVPGRDNTLASAGLGAPDCTHEPRLADEGGDGGHPSHPQCGEKLASMKMGEET